MPRNEKLSVEIVIQFIRSYPPYLEFPSGKPLEIPSKVEILFMDKVQACDVDKTVISKVRALIGNADAYSLIIFAVRMAIWAVRQRNEQLLKKSLWALFVDDDQVDWRDMLGALSIIEDCSKRIYCDFESMINEFIFLAAPNRRATIQDGYLSRSPETREIDTMGFVVLGNSDKSIDYKKRE